MTNYKLKLFTILMLPLAIQSAAITDWNQQLLDAARNGNLAQVKKALDNGANINFDDINDHGKWTSLHWAARFGHTKVLKALILAKANIDAKLTTQNTPLHLAAIHGHTDVVNALIIEAAIIDSKNKDQETPLQLAAHWRRIEIVKILLDVGSNLTLVNKYHQTIFDVISKNLLLPIDRDKQDQLIKIIKDHQVYQASMLKELPTLFIAQYDQLKVPEPIAKLITQYAFGICEIEKNNKGDNLDKL